MNEETESTKELIKGRLDFLAKHKTLLCFLGLIAVILLSIYIRTSNIHALVDVTTGKPTLSPDLDPFLFLRWAKYIVANGSLMSWDYMRSAPLGYSTEVELPGMPYTIAYLYHFLSFFGSTTVEWAAILVPLISSVFILIFFYLTTREIFAENKAKDLIALIATFFMATIPGFIHRTVSGVPDKEGPAFALMFAATWLFIKSLRADRWYKSLIYGGLAGLATGMMALFWGGVNIVFILCGLTMFVYFFTARYKTQDILGFGAWIAGSFVIMIDQSRYGLSVFTIIYTAFPILVLGIMIFHALLQRYGQAIINYASQYKINSKVLALLLCTIVGGILLAMFRLDILIGAFKRIESNLLYSFGVDRLTLTIAEDMKVYFRDWVGQTGQILFVFLGALLMLTYDLGEKLSMKNRKMLVGGILIAIAGICLTYLDAATAHSALNNFLFVASLLFSFGTALWIYFKEEMDFDCGLLFALIFAIGGLISARGAVRLLMFLFPIVCIIIGYVAVRLWQWTIEENDKAKKLFWFTIAISVLMLSVWTGYIYTMASYNQVAYGEIPHAYEMQWQEAMGWVRTETPQNATFISWWDYNYWTQTMGERRTVIDGGNAIAYWNYLTAREVLTTPNENDSLSFLKTHEVDYLLIDSSDIGKYPAFSSIGSDENMDRFSSIATFKYDIKQTSETRNQTLLAFSGGVNIDEDILYKNKIFRAGGNSGIGGFIVPISKIDGSIGQPKAVIFTNGIISQVPVNCVYFNGTKRMYFDGDSINGCAYIIPDIEPSRINQFGAVIWLSPRLMRSEFTKIYFFNESVVLQLVHQENALPIQQLNDNYGLGIPPIALVQGQLFAPIDIWKINYPQDIKTNDSFLALDFPDELRGRT